MSIIRIKRSSSSGSPGALAQGEMAYSFLGGTQANGGDRLYIGTGTEVGGVAANIEVIGGKYFTEKLDHTPGTVTANSALIVDALSKLDILNIDNITIDGNSITSTNSNGNITLNPNGTGVVDVSTSRITNVVNPTTDQDAATKKYVDDQFAGGSVIFTIAADSGIADTVAGQQTVTFAGSTGITTSVTDNRIDIDLDDTAVTPGSYGDANTAATFTVDQQGRLTAAGVTDINHDTLLNFVANEHIDHSAVTLTAGSGLTGGGNITDSRTFNVGAGVGITVNADDVAVNAGDGLVANSTGTHINVSGDSSLVANTTGLFVIDSTLAIAPTQLTSDVILGTHTSGDYVQNLVAGTGVTLLNNSGEGSTPTISIGQAVETTSNVTFNDVTVDGDLIVNGTTTTFNTNTITVEDSLIFLGSNNTADAIDLGWVGQYNDGVNKYAGMFRNSADAEFYLFDVYTTAFSNNNIDTTDPSFSLAVLNADTFVGALSGNATTATTLQTARTIALSGDVVGSVNFNGSQNVTISTTIQPNSVALGTDTTGNYVATVAVTAGTGLSVSGSGSETAAVTLAGVDATTSTKGVASFSSDNFTVTSGAVAISALDGGTY